MIVRAIKYILLLAIAAALMWYALRGHDPDSIRQLVKDVDYSWIIISVILAVAVQFSRAWRWRMQLDAAGEKTSFMNVYHALVIGSLTNVATPQVGEVIRCTVLRRTDNIRVRVSIGTVIAEHTIDLLMLVLLLALVLLTESEKVGSYFISRFFGENDAGSSANTMMVGLAVSLAILSLLVYLVYRNFWRVRDKRAFRVTAVFMSGLLAGLLSVRKIEKKGVFILHTITTWLLNYLRAYLTFFAFAGTAHLDAMAGLSVMVLGTFGMWAPVQGGFGTYHLLVQGTLLIYDVPAEIGITYAIVTHGIQVLQTIVAGMISLLLTQRLLPTAGKKIKSPGTGRSF